MHRFLAWLLDVPPSEPGQGISWRFSHAFPWPGWLLLLFGIAVTVYVVAIYRRDAGHLSRLQRMTLASLRLAAIAVLLVILSELTLSVERVGLPYVVMLLDTSASMGTRDDYPSSEQKQAVIDLMQRSEQDDPTRLNLAKGLLLQENGSLLRELIGNHKLRVYSVAESEALIGNSDYLNDDEFDTLLPELRRLSPVGQQSRLGDGLRRVLNNLRGTPPSAVILFSDGINTDGEELAAAAKLARQKAVPVYTVTLGDSAPALDVALTDVVVDEVAFVNDPITVSYKLSGSGFAGQPVTVQLKRRGEETPLSTSNVAVSGDARVQKFELTYTPTEVAELDVVIEATPLKGEANTRNNSEIRHISVRKEKIRVLLADGLPRWEFRELKFLLEREKTIELKTVLQDADPEFSSEDRTAITNFPARREDLFQFDVVILGDVDLAFLSTGVQENLREFVNTKGGGVLFIAGTASNPLQYAGTPLEPMLPIELATTRIPSAVTITEPFNPELTIEGQKGSAMFRFGDTDLESQQIWSQLPGIFWMVESPDLKPGAIVMATHPIKSGTNGKLPLISMQRYGGGKVLFQATDETWRWRFRSGDEYYGRYWVQLVRYLSRSSLLGRDRGAELVTDRKIYSAGDTVEMRVRFVDERLAPTNADGVTVVLEQTGEPQRKVTLKRLASASNVFETQIQQIAEGGYHAWVATPSFAETPPSQDFRVESPARESRVLRANRAEMSAVASGTLGKTYTVETADELARDIPPGLPVVLEADAPIGLWNHWLAMVLFTTCLGTEWLLRKRWRLI